MNRYEHTLIVKQDLSESQNKKIIDKYESIINKNLGKVVKTEDALRDLQDLLDFPIIWRRFFIFF